MKKVPLFLLLLLAVILCPKISKAQMQSYFTAGSTSTKRQGTTQPQKVIKVQAINPKRILTLVQLNTTSSAFYITIDNSYVVEVASFSGRTITDFEVFGTDVYFCGSKIENGADWGFIAKTNLSTISSSITISEQTFSDIVKFEKIDVYKDSINQVKLSLIGDSVYFVDFNLTTLSYRKFRAVFGVRLLDVVHTNDYIGVLGMENDSTFTIFSHDKQTPTTLITGYGKTFRTDGIYDNIDNVPRYYIESLDDGLNNVVVGYAAKGRTVGLEFCNIDLSNITVNNTQGISNEIFLRTKFADLKYNKSNQSLLCLVYNQNAYTSFDDNILEQIQPYNTSAYNIYVTIPDPLLHSNLLRTIAPYGDNFYLSAGREFMDYVYWFDKILGYNEHSCNNIMECEVVPVSNPRWVSTISYRSSQHTIQSATYTKNLYLGKFNVNCQ